MAERNLVQDRLEHALFISEAWISFQSLLQQAFRDSQHVVVRGVPLIGDGLSFMSIAQTAIHRFRRYRGGHVVKHFKMSPWTEDLSHTTRDGHFHTDLNTAKSPPDVTAMQCVRCDPGGNGYGALRVAGIRDLVLELRAAGDAGAVEFLEQRDVEMVDYTGAGSWIGKIVSGDTVRYHPSTIVAAKRRRGEEWESLKPVLDRIHAAAMNVSSNIDLSPGDVLIVSNTRALHYRGPCTVRFRRFPRDFDAREVYVLHGTAAR
jgi:hypothetical protein